MQAFGVFEGGGVRGYAHVGALKACEDRNIDLCGVAGTSIGAIVAALVAVGYESRELYAIGEDGSEGGLFAVDVVKEFFEAREFKRLDRLLKAIGFLKSMGRVVKNSSDSMPGGKVVAQAFGQIWSFNRRLWTRRLTFATATAPLPSMAAGLFAVPHWPLLNSAWTKSGVLDGTRFATWLNTRLAEKLGLPANACVTFDDIEMPLVFIAANLSQGRMTTFERATHGGTSVAEAAIASAAYPLVFKPRRLNDEIYVDGGLVSNFPAWALDNARAIRETTVPTFGFRVVDAPVEAKIWPAQGDPDIIGVVRRIVTTAAFGRGDLESRRIDDLHPIQVETPIKATDFSRIAQERASLYEQGRQRLHAYFASELGPRDPAEMEEKLRRVFDIVRDVTGALGPIRAYLIRPVDAVFARVVYSALLPGDADDALVLRLASASQTLCLARREPVLMRSPRPEAAQRRSPATKYLHALRPNRVTHVYCIPMFEDWAEWSKIDPQARAQPVAALCLDFGQANDLLLLDRDAEDTLAALADAFVDVWKDRSRLWPETTDLADQAAAPDWTPVTDALGYYISSRKMRKLPDEDRRDQIERATIPRQRRPVRSLGATT